jgi:hypothetical protein
LGELVTSPDAVAAGIPIPYPGFVQQFGGGAAASYTTDFPNAEPLISEGGHWITAGTPGVNWYATLCGGDGVRHISSVSTTPGYASGPTGPAPFGDSLALLTGTWSPDQMAQETVREVRPSGSPEVEIRLRTSPKDATGYEITWSTFGKHASRAFGKTESPFVTIATWNGPSSAPPHYTILKELHGPDYGVVTGDVVKATIVGNIITGFKNGKQQFQITDNTFSTGNPGFGFNEGPSGTYGITSFTASDMVSHTPIHATSYTTAFPNTEPLISEGGHWITAGTPGVNWYDTLSGGKGDQHISSVSTTPGYASGPTGPERFGDALALLTGTWNPDQMAQETVHEINPFWAPEVEIRLRTSPKDATGYEIMWSAFGKTGNSYVAIATWNGPSSAPPHFTILKELHGPDYGVVTGDVVKATIVGNIITGFKNGKQQFQITDNTFSTGNPGFGFDEGPSGTYGITGFTASDMVSDVPIITSTLSVTGTVGTAITPYQITASNNPTSYGATGLPAWASVNTATGVIIGTPTAAGTSSVTISATNASGTGTATLTLTVRTLPSAACPRCGSIRTLARCEWRGAPAIAPAVGQKIVLTY